MNQEPSTLLIRNARVITMDRQTPCAEAVRLRNGLVLDHRDDATGIDHVIDAEGRLVVPGLVDSHLHLIQGGLSLGQLDLSEATSRDRFEQLIAQEHAELPSGQWLRGHGWSETDLGDLVPDAGWLAACGDRPAICYRMDYHVCVVNEAVLEMIPDGDSPEGGAIMRDDSGRRTGVFVEQAAWKLINPLVPDQTAGQKIEALMKAQDHLLSLGVTSVGTYEYARDLHDVLVPSRGDPEIRCMVSLLDREWPLDTTIGADVQPCQRLEVIGFKSFIDGTLGARTARMLQPYADAPDSRGLLVELAADGLLGDWVARVLEAGRSPSMHAIGDEAVRLALDALDEAGDTRRGRIEHAQTIHEDDLPRCRDRWLSMQPYHRADDGRFAMTCLGRERMPRFFPFRSLLDNGAKLAFGSDWPVVNCDPIEGMHAATSGRDLDGRPVNEKEAITGMAALEAYTSSAADMLGLHGCGRLGCGHNGDLVMLDGELPPDDRGCSAVLTISGGAIVYDRR